jgi:pantoate--beta-alanine ligase
MADHVVASIFVNPRQFGANEDLDALSAPVAGGRRIAGRGCGGALGAHARSGLSGGYATNISVSGVSEGLCGGTRPGHFDGVATVVCKLFNQVSLDIALFGEKTGSNWP